MAAPPSGPRHRAPAAPMHPFYTRAATMIGEIAAAVSFISKFLRTKGLTSERQLQTFSQSLQELLAGEWAAVEGRGVPCGARAPHLRTEPSGRREPGSDSGWPRSGAAAGPGLELWAAANGGSWRGFGGWSEGRVGGLLPPRLAKWRGRRKQTHNKETKGN